MEKMVKKMEIIEFEKNGIKRFKKTSYTKADKLFYFNKEKLDYYVFGSISDDLLEDLMKLILHLSEKDKITLIIENLL